MLAALLAVVVLAASLFATFETYVVTVRGVVVEGPSPTLTAIDDSATATTPEPTTSPQEPSSACDPVLLDFVEAPAGTVLSTQFAEAGVHISGVGNNGVNEVVVFALEPSPELPAGKVARLAENSDDLVDNGTGLPPADGLVDQPDESAVGGTQTYLFDDERVVRSLVVLAGDDPADGGEVRLLGKGGVLLGSILLGSMAIGFESDAGFTAISVNVGSVRRMEVEYAGTGGVTNIDLGCASETATATQPSTPEGPVGDPDDEDAPTALGDATDSLQRDLLEFLGEQPPEVLELNLTPETPTPTPEALAAEPDTPEEASLDAQEPTPTPTAEERVMLDQ